MTSYTKEKCMQWHNSIRQVKSNKQTDWYLLAILSLKKEKELIILNIYSFQFDNDPIYLGLTFPNE